MNLSTNEQARLLLELEVRRLLAQPIDNAAQPAGADMRYYCRNCKALTAHIAESDFSTRIPKHCGLCLEMKEYGYSLERDRFLELSGGPGALGPGERKMDLRSVLEAYLGRALGQVMGQSELRFDLPPAILATVAVVGNRPALPAQTPASRGVTVMHHNGTRLQKMTRVMPGGPAVAPRVFLEALARRIHDGNQDQFYRSVKFERTRPVIMEHIVIPPEVGVAPGEMMPTLSEQVVKRIDDACMDRAEAMWQDFDRHKFLPAGTHHTAYFNTGYLLQRSIGRLLEFQMRVRTIPNRVA